MLPRVPRLQYHAMYLNMILGILLGLAIAAWWLRHSEADRASTSFLRSHLQQAAKKASLSRMGNILASMMTNILLRFFEAYLLLAY